MKSKPTAPFLRSEYLPWLAGLKDRVRSAQLQAAARVNHELLRLYWDLGRAIANRQKQAGWGAAIIPQLAADLHAEFPDMAGFSERNFGRMVAFYREYSTLFSILPQPAAKLAVSIKGPQPVAQIPGEPASSIVPQAAAKLTPAAEASPILPPAGAKSGWPDSTSAIVQQVAAKLPWFHHVILLEKVKDRAARVWYMQAAVAHGWSRSVLTVQIAQRASGLHRAKKAAAAPKTG